MTSHICSSAHDLAVVAHSATASRDVSRAHCRVAAKAELFENPRHPYTQALLASVPVADPKVKRLKPMIDGCAEPDQSASGCAFHTRCRYVMDRCKLETPALTGVGAQHQVACWLNEGTGREA